MIRKIFTSQICVGVFVVAFIASLFLLPANILHGKYLPLAIIFMLLFAVNMTCFVYAIKEKVDSARAAKSSILGIIATVLGFSALSVCGMGAHLCGAAIGSGILMVFMPATAIRLFTEYSVQIVIFAIFSQLLALYLMGCFQRIRNGK